MSTQQKNDFAVTAIGTASRAVAEVNNRFPSALLSALPQLPSLANKCYIVGQARRADVVWSRADFLAICEHMLNGNSLSHFLAAWEDSETGEARFAKAYRARADKRASWAWATITTKTKVGTSIGFYPSNNDGMTRWGAIDFDAHDGAHERARKWSLAAFQLLLSHPELYLVLCTSGGGGFHLFIFTREVYRIGEWILLLKQVCQLIGAEIADGVCEIFPNEKAESQRTGKAIRAPGTFNPKTGNPSLIEAETIQPLLQSLPRTWSSFIGKVNRRLLRNGHEVSLHKSTNTYSLSTEGLIENVIQQHPILRKGTRNGVLMKLIGDLAHKFGFEKAREAVECHYNTYSDYIATALDEHLRQFDDAWRGQCEKIRNRFSPMEKKVFDQLHTNHQREAFRIVWAFAGAAEKNGRKDFPIGRDSLADRLSVTQAGASDIIRALIQAGAIRETRPYKPHKSLAHYRWLLRRRGDTADRHRTRDTQLAV
jgi:hypothetical protein